MLYSKQKHDIQDLSYSRTHLLNSSWLAWHGFFSSSVLHLHHAPQSFNPQVPPKVDSAFCQIDRERALYSNPHKKHSSYSRPRVILTLLETHLSCTWNLHSATKSRCSWGGACCQRSWTNWWQKSNLNHLCLQLWQLQLTIRMHHW